MVMYEIEIHDIVPTDFWSSTTGQRHQCVLGTFDRRFTNFVGSWGGGL